MSDEVLSFYAVRPSALHGMGLFATQWIPQDTVIGRVQGPAAVEDGPHVLWVDDQTGFRVDNEMRYINHHPDPNACYDDDLTVVALRDIHSGEEITHHHGEDRGGALDEAAG